MTPSDEERGEKGDGSPCGAAPKDGHHTATIKRPRLRRKPLQNMTRASTTVSLYLIAMRTSVWIQMELLYGYRLVKILDTSDDTISTFNFNLNDTARFRSLALWIRRGLEMPLYEDRPSRGSTRRAKERAQPLERRISMITRTTRLALLLAVAVLTYARPEPVDAAMDGRKCVSASTLATLGARDCVDLGSGCMTIECRADVGPVRICLSVEGCPPA